MTKLKFLFSLRDQLSGLPEEELEERISFYSEMIEDRMEDGLSEEEAVAEIGSVEEVASQIISDIPLSKIALEKIQPKRQLKMWEILLLALGAPVWLPLLISAVAVIFSVYVVLWSVIISLWAVFGSVIACAFAGIVSGIGFMIGANGLTGAAMVAAGIVCAGLSIFLFYGCMAATNGTIRLAKILMLGIKKCFIRKVDTQ